MLRILHLKHSNLWVKWPFEVSVVMWTMWQYHTGKTQCFSARSVCSKWALTKWFSFSIIRIYWPWFNSKNIMALTHPLTIHLLTEVQKKQKSFAFYFSYVPICWSGILSSTWITACISKQLWFHWIRNDNCHQPNMCSPSIIIKPRNWLLKYVYHQRGNATGIHSVVRRSKSVTLGDVLILQCTVTGDHWKLQRPNSGRTTKV